MIALASVGLWAALSRRRVVLSMALIAAFSLAIVAIAFRGRGRIRAGWNRRRQHGGAR